jgi:hypothetical protein
LRFVTPPDANTVASVALVAVLNANAVPPVPISKPPTVATVASPATPARRNRLVAEFTPASIREVVVARWLQPEGAMVSAPPI